jgi:hypothetical protein
MPAEALEQLEDLSMVIDDNEYFMPDLDAETAAEDNFTPKQGLKRAAWTQATNFETKTG